MRALRTTKIKVGARFGEEKASIRERLRDEERCHLLGRVEKEIPTQELSTDQTIDSEALQAEVDAQCGE